MSDVRTMLSSEELPDTMRAARYHEIGKPFSVDVIDRPRVRPDDVVVQVKACGLVPNYKTALGDLPSGISRPAMPAVYGLDTAGVIVDVGDRVHGLNVGDRVYVNPLRGCGNCRQCRLGRTQGCDYLALNAYFGSGAKAAETMSLHPHGGFCEYITAPPSSLVLLPDSVSFEHGARWGYIGTGYAAVRRAGVGNGTTVLVNGVSGTLGVGALLFSLAMGAKKVLGVGRNRELLEQAKAVDPARVEVLSTLDEQSTADWAKSLTGGQGVDVVIDALPFNGRQEVFQDALRSLGRFGVHVNVGGVLGEVPIDVWSMTNLSTTMTGSFWFSTAQGQEMADLAESGQVDLSVIENVSFPLESINEAMAELGENHSGFINYVVAPELSAVIQPERQLGSTLTVA